MSSKACESSAKEGGRRRSWGRAVNYFWLLLAPNAPFWAKLPCVCSRWRSCRSGPTATHCPHCHPLSPRQPQGHPKGHPSLAGGLILPFFLAGSCAVQLPALEFNTLQAACSDEGGSPAVPKKGDTSARDAGGTAPSCRDGCAIKPHIGVSWDTGIIHSLELNLSPPALFRTFKTGRDKGQATKRAVGSNPALAQVLHFHTRREEPCSRCRARLRRRCQSG